MNATIGMKVTGNYYGAAFTGTITSERPHTVNWNRTVVSIKLDTPINVLDLERDTVMMEVYSDGREKCGNYIQEVK